MTSVFTGEACSYHSLSCNLLSTLPSTIALMTVRATTQESVTVAISSPYSRQLPPPHPALVVEGLQSLTAASKLESRREHNKTLECLDCLDCLSPPKSPGKMTKSLCQDAG